MGKAEIIADLGAGYYTIKRMYAGRDAAQDKIVLFNTNITELQSRYSLMPELTEDELFAKYIVKLQITSLQKQVEYIENNFPADIEVDAYCADYTEELSGEVGTIDIPGEVTDLVNIRPGYDETAVFDAERDGEFWPSIAVGPWTCFLNKCILPGWQKWYPKYRYGWIVPGSIDYDDNTCAVTIQPAYSSQQDLDVNQEDGFGAEVVEEELELSYFQQDITGFTDFIDFCERNPEHPSCSSTLAPPIEISNEQYQALDDINVTIDYFFEYESDKSGYDIGDHWNTMYDLGDEWVDYGATFADGRPIIGPPRTRRGDCEDYVLTKIQAIVEKDIIPAENLQIIICSIDGNGHAVLGIQTSNRGFLILDQREYAIREKSTLDRTHRWKAFSVAGTYWAAVQRLKGDVPVEYMNCGALAFMGDDEVVVEFTGLDWNQPKVIGFSSNPKTCTRGMFFPEMSTFHYGGGRSNYAYSEPADVWSYHGNFTHEKVPSSPAAAGLPGIGLYVGGRIYLEPYVWSSYFLVNAFNGTTYGPWPISAQYQEETDLHFAYDTTAETWEVARASGIEAEDQNYKGLSNGCAIVHGGALHEYWSHGWSGNDSIHHYESSLAHDPYDDWEWGDPPEEVEWVVRIVGVKYDRGGYLHVGPAATTRNQCSRKGKRIYGDTKKYTLSSDSWTFLQAGPARYRAACFVINDNLYIVGGLRTGDAHCGLTNAQTAYEKGPFYQVDKRHSNYPDGPPQEIDAMWLRRGHRMQAGWLPPQRGVADNGRYRVSTDSWEEKQSFPYALWEARGFSLVGRGYVGGGAHFDEWPELCPEVPPNLDFSRDLHFSDTGWVDYPEIHSTMSSKGFWYDEGGDVWVSQPCQAVGMGDFCGGRWGASELNGKQKGLRIGKRHWTSSQNWVLDPITETWQERNPAYTSMYGPGTLPGRIDYEHRRRFGSGEPGAEC